MSHKIAIIVAILLAIIAIAIVLFVPKPDYRQSEIVVTTKSAIDNNLANFIAPEVKKTIAKNHKQEWVIYVDRNYKISLVCKHEHCDINDSGETQKVDFRIIDGDRNIFNLIDINKSLISNAVNLDIYAQVIADDREIISDASGIAKLKGEFGYALELRFYSYAIDVRVLEFYDKVLFATLQNPPTTQEFNSSSEIKDIKINGVKKAIILK